MSNPLDLPASLPVPGDDGAAKHLIGRALPRIALTSTAGSSAFLGMSPGRTVIYVYVRMAPPGEEIPDEWNAIPGARGCTPQSCAFRDHAEDMARLGASVEGLSTQSPEEQCAAVRRLHLPFTLFSDEDLAFAHALALPLFEYHGRTLLRRLTMVVDERMIRHVFYPVFPPDAHAGEVLKWLHENPRGALLAP